MSREIGIGSGLAVLFFLAMVGIDVMPILVIIALLGALYFINNMRTSSKSLTISGNGGQSISKLTFDDIGGQNTAKKELCEALDFICQEEKISKLGIRPLKGILLSGPPGTGKTLLAKAAAHYTNAVFLSCSGSEFVEMYVGVGAQRIRQLFRQAKNLARQYQKKYAIIFIDEIEILGGKRGQNTNHLEYDQTLNQLLVEMDGLKPDDDVRILLIGATNRIDILDEALLRPGRFDRFVKVDLPDRQGRLQILKIHTKHKPLAPDVDLEEIAQATFGFSGAHLESVANEAAIFAFREGSTLIHKEHFREAIDKVMMGEKLDRTPKSEEMYRVAVHELGHALLSEKVRPESVANITVTPRGGALGYMRQTQNDDTYLYTKELLEDQIKVFLAGALAEELSFGSRSTGASNDFQEAGKLAKKIVLAGMSDLGIVYEESLPQEKMHNAITQIINEQEALARKVITENLNLIIRMAELLLNKEVISGDEFRKMLSDPAYCATECA